MKNGFLRVAACVPEVTLGDTNANVVSITKMLDEAAQKGAVIVVMPEMCLTGYTCGDLFHNSTLLQSVEPALNTLSAACPESIALAVIGAPVIINGLLYNCAVAFNHSGVLGIVPKTYLPNYNEFYEARWFAPASDEANIVFEVEGVKIGVEICEDLWAPIPPSSRLALSGAEIILNLSASDEVIGKYQYLQTLIKQQSARSMCAYVYASAGAGESSTDLVFDGKAFICENGHMLASRERFADYRDPEKNIAIADVDILAIRHDRLHNTTFGNCAARNTLDLKVIKAQQLAAPTQHSDNQLLRYINPHPFVPSDKSNLDDRCEEIITVQSMGLRRRLRATGCKHLVIGISGGLDSTLALLVAVKAFDDERIPRSGIVGVTMPGFGTSGRTRENAVKLMQLLGITSREISIVKSVEQHLLDIEHSLDNHDVTYENAQARERTQILMDVANQVGGMVLGTGDLSELALGWATYNGDHMSMYAVNVSVPKTLVYSLVKHYASRYENKRVAETLKDIVDTPISPELIPADSQGNITQVTEDLVGPYELHDFFLYYTIRYGFTPERIFLLAQHAFGSAYDKSVILKWLKVFYKRFFAQQFKRSCLPDGPKIGTITLSPRGDWRMPSDATAAMWLASIDKISEV